MLIMEGGGDNFLWNRIREFPIGELDICKTKKSYEHFGNDTFDAFSVLSRECVQGLQINHLVERSNLVIGLAGGLLTAKSAGFGAVDPLIGVVGGPSSVICTWSITEFGLGA